MPELPDITVYIEALERHVRGRTLTRVELPSPFVLRTAEPPISEIQGHRVIQLKRIGKRIALGFDNSMWLVAHLMIAGRLAWAGKIKGKGGRNVLARLFFDEAVLTFTEAGTRKRASLHLLGDDAALAFIDPGGLEVLDCDFETFKEVLTRRNHTLKRALTDPRLFSGIGNGYSDEILHAACLSPIKQTQKLEDDEISRLHRATVRVLGYWIERLREATGDGFPSKVTAFREGMAVHGRYGEPCPACQTAIQRIRYVGNELNYCPRCQTEGRMLADRALSRLLRKDWPRSIEELEHAQSSHDGRSG